MGALVGAAPAAANADTPAHTDVMFVFDTTGSMGGALTEAKKEIQDAMTQISSSLPDAQFGIAEMRDYSSVNFNGFPGIYEFDEGLEAAYEIGSGNQPWTLKRPITADRSAIAEALASLVASGGGDGPEAYGRALYETDVNPAVGWRSGARGVIVLIADNLPHDADLNEGIPTEFQLADSPLNTSPDPGVDNTLGTSDDLDWQSVVLRKLAEDGRPLEYVDFHGDDRFIPYWQSWAGATGGTVITAKGEEDLGSKLVEAVKLGAALPPCPSGQVRNSESVCVPIPPPPVSNNFKIEPRISCAKGCYVVEVKIVFDSNGYVIAESVLNEEPAARTSGAAVSGAKAPQAACGKGKSAKSSKGGKCKKPALIAKLSQPVTAGPNTLALKLTGAAKKVLNKKGKLPLKVNFAFTPTGGTAKTTTQTFLVKAPSKAGKPKQGPKGH
jgi:hypothetical protein